jgi:hypothetical protein
MKCILGLYKYEYTVCIEEGGGIDKKCIPVETYEV